MRISVFTSNQPRHLSFIARLASVCDDVIAVQECNAAIPDFSAQSPILRDYFQHVTRAEAEVFGGLRFSAKNVSTLSLRMGDVSRVPLEVLAPALTADICVVFGASYIKGALCEALVAKKAYNLHIGISPYYRGAATNFWALYDQRPEFVGATVHLLTKGLDSGPMLFHTLPRTEAVDPFLLGMKAVRSAHDGFIARVIEGGADEWDPLPQDKSRELRHSKTAEFTESIAAEYLKRVAAPSFIEEKLAQRSLDQFVRPFISPS